MPLIYSVSCVSGAAFQRSSPSTLCRCEEGIPRPDAAEERIITHVGLDEGDIVDGQTQRRTNYLVDFVHAGLNLAFDSKGIEPREQRHERRFGGGVFGHQE